MTYAIPVFPPADPTRRRFLSSAAGIAAGGTALALATVPPSPAVATPASPLVVANAGPALRAAATALDDTRRRMEEARAAFDAADRLPRVWRTLNPKPIERRAIKKWSRREREYRRSAVIGAWRALTDAEADFRDAQMVVAKIDARDMGELAFKACLSIVHDAAGMSRPNAAVIGFSVALNLVSLTVADVQNRVTS